jgi:hypothetical protein
MRIAAAVVLLGFAAASAAEEPRRFGLVIDGGLPNGVGASAFVSPWRPLRLEVGASYNLLAFGVRGGVTVIPFELRVAPVLHAYVVHAFGGDATGLVSRFARLDATEELLLRDVSYDHVGVELGVELAVSRRVALFARAGLGWFRASVTGFQAAVRATRPGSTLEAEDPVVRGTVPTVSVGTTLAF